MSIAGVIDDQVEDAPHTTLVYFVDETSDICDAPAEQFVDGVVVRYIITHVFHGRIVER